MVKAFVIAAALASVATAQTEIVNGTEAPVGKYLYVSGLRKTETGRASCGGSLIAPTVLLTAAHCAGAWSNTTVGPYTLKFASIGSHFTAGDKDGERIEIVSQTIHPKYNETIFDYDFAIFELKSPSKYAPVQISWDHQPEGVTSWIRGFGDTTSGGDQPDVLLEASVVTWDQKKCADKYASIAEYGEEVTDSMLCAGGLDKDTCQGDSGGPLTFVKDDQEFLAGVTSWGIGCADVGVPGVYSRISKARDFIEPFLTKPSC